MPAAIVSAPFENGGKPGQIGIDVGEWVVQRMSHTGLRAKVNDMRKTELFEQVRNPLAIGKIQFYEAKSVRLRKLRKARFFQSWVIIGVHIVEANHVVPVTQQTPCDMEADKAGRAGHQNRAADHA